jgi:hypothetical protein
VPIYGSSAECTERAQAQLDAGVDYIPFDFQYPGLESEHFVKEQMCRCAEEVVPLLNEEPATREGDWLRTRISREGLSGIAVGVECERLETRRSRLGSLARDRVAGVAGSAHRGRT